ncbi:hypothetical protein HBI56_059390 [Parastagonospora nodorum]|nr:hypothetical protein HBI10_072240 [Parastagonospora nodorum]KAH4018076.1 hypothetical protein HBI13_138890 [Parastagonospora nodorum]KAH4036315.1 hypothetical protein HBI09_085470 [Parastagonospora nodorum]KAH4164124.1 hypothetical protein HBH43_151220 [Parastagonospora nodorum]KAH4347241.1 hypothetical protein HBH98_090920 [Parastagonospora nodorum]
MNSALATHSPTKDSFMATATPEPIRALPNFARSFSFIQRSPDLCVPSETQATDSPMPSYGKETSKPRKSSKHAATKKPNTTLSANDRDVHDRDDPLTTTSKHKTASKKMNKKTRTQTASIADVKSAGYALPSEMSYAIPSYSSRMTQMKGGDHTASMTTMAAAPILVTTKLWHPAKSNAKKIGIPKLLLGLLSLRASIVDAHNVPREDTSQSITTALIPTTLVPFVLPAKAAALTCSAGQERCSDNLCFDKKSQVCCPGEAIVCTSGTQCAFSKLGDGTMIYTCAPADARNGTDPRIYTGSMVTVRPTATGNATLPKPTGNGEARLGVPGVFKHIALLGNVVRAVAFPSEVFGECCIGICCKPGESCARSSEGPKCWPGAEAKVAEADIADKEVHTSKVAPVNDIARSEARSADEVDTQDVKNKKGGGGHGSGGGGGRGGSRPVGGGGHKSSAGDRLTFAALHVLWAAGLAFLMHRWF